MVVGGGLAGLVVGDELVRRGNDVVVLEAQGRPGGRILTVRDPLPSGLFVEAGATHVVGDPDLLAVLARHGVPLAPRRPRPRDVATVVVRDGRRVQVPPGTDPPASHRLTAEEEALGEDGRRERYLGAPAAADPRGAWPPAGLERLDDLSIGALLRERGASAGYLASFAEAGYGDGLESVSAAFVLRDVAAMRREIEQGGGGRIEGGADRLPRAIAARLGDRLVLGARVVAIEHGSGTASVVFDRGGQRERLGARRVVCAMPHTVLREVRFTPGLSPAKQRALDEVPSASVTRLFAHLRSRPWVQRGERGTVDTDVPLGRVRDETELLAGDDAVLGAYLTGPLARSIAAMGDDARRRAWIEHLERAHPGVAHDVGVVLSKAWDEDPCARGAYAYFRPGQMRELAPALAAAEGVLHFAGDHTSYRPGFMHGAVASARRVVAEIGAAGRPE